ncbi:flagellar hook-basal body complex protein FliE [Carnobacterium iners]|uniref:Flagellar hook-basal body complex protein FliE n=1 Tax=Carnobacterium iners TaxID=1073423 RepID=A0A1X7N052_9LACT|nr:flagellar hook-basal body complex protein FliE [Carnobacterium iners]SEK21727.1 flagellar hook-basal body complex protein FliE [Carnobacterium iners]SMH30616.1 flagellar hook-basal body complex protein FliE [Carnobacterium iners]
MNIEKLATSLLTGESKPVTQAMKAQEAPESGSFSGMVEQAMVNLNDKQLAADQAVQGLAAGDADNLHTVMIRTSEAQLTLDLALQMRNKCLEAYNEVKNMQF